MTLPDCMIGPSEPCAGYVELQRQTEHTCLWQQDYIGGEYETSCSRSFMFQDDSNLEDNDFKFCPFCGGKIIPNEPTDEGDERD